ncbi:MAG TPA: acyl-CoA dehydrogenase family protein [Streptosporangiaceae bacterium]|nr:acyl-CoA dehydrogenase family protein [Streptosporangiaceae bacterium]
MDFTPGETQQEIASLAARVLQAARPVSVCAAAGPAGAAAPSETYDRALWKELGQAGLLSLALPGWLDGDGLGVLDIAFLLTEIGRQGAAVPALATVMMGAAPVIRWGDRGLQQALLAGVATGEVVLTAALREPSDPMPARPATTATLAGGSGTVSGVKVGVPYCAEASRVLVPASVAGGGTAVVVIDPSEATVVRTHSSGGEPEYTLRLAQAPVLGVLAEGAVSGLYQLALAGACCVADGAVAAALALTTEHIGSRQQFGRPLAAFQAAAQHIADVYIVARTLHLAVTSACWRLAEGLDAGPDLDVAAYWLASRAPAALRTCHHLHGGTGMDVTYPLPRFSALIKDLVRFAGGASYRLDRLALRIREMRI